MEALEFKELDVKELELEEQNEVNGGDGLTEAVFYGAGYAWEWFKDVAGSQPHYTWAK